MFHVKQMVSRETAFTLKQSFTVETIIHATDIKVFGMVEGR